MQNSFNINLNDETRNGLEVEIIKNEDKDNYITLSLNNLSSSENDETFLKKLYSVDSDERVPFDSEETFRKETYFGSTDETTDEIVCSTNLPSQAHPDIDSLPVIPRSPEDGWSFELLLAYLSHETTTEDLEMIKFLVIGTDDENGMQSFANASSIKIYDLLRRRKFITTNDLLYLQVIMAVLRKETLIAIVYKFAQSKKNVLHFDPPLKDLVICDSLEEVSVRGPDFRCYSSVQLHEFCFRIKEIIAAFTRGQKSTSSNRLLMSCVYCDRSDMHSFVDKTNETIDSFSQEETDVKGRRSRSHTILCDTGLQTDSYQKDLEQENIHLKGELSEAKHCIQEQSKEIFALKAALETFDAQNLQYNDQQSFQTSHAEVVEKFDNLDANDSYLKGIKSIEYQLNSLKKDNAVMSMKISSFQSLQDEYKENQEKYNEMSQKYEETVKENRELKVEKTNTEIQMGVLQKNFEELEKKLKTRIGEENSLIIGLKNELEMTAASLLNAQNDKRLHELTRCLEQIASMSMTVKKVYGNFDPAHEHISPEQDELFRKALSGKIGRIYPQIYYQTEKR